MTTHPTENQATQNSNFLEDSKSSTDFDNVLMASLRLSEDERHRLAQILMLSGSTRPINDPVDLAEPDSLVVTQEIAQAYLNSIETLSVYDQINAIEQALEEDMLDDAKSLLMTKRATLLSSHPSVSLRHFVTMQARQRPFVLLLGTVGLMIFIASMVKSVFSRLF